MIPWQAWLFGALFVGIIWYGVIRPPIWRECRAHSSLMYCAAVIR